MSKARPFEDFYEPVTESGCWIWMGAIDSKGYGGIKVNGKQMSAHRRSWVIANGDIPSGLHVLRAWALKLKATVEGMGHTLYCKSAFHGGNEDFCTCKRGDLLREIGGLL